MKKKWLQVFRAFRARDACGWLISSVFLGPTTGDRDREARNRAAMTDEPRTHAKGVGNCWGLACRKCSPHRLEVEQLPGASRRCSWEDTYLSVLVCGGEGKLRERVEALELRAVAQARGGQGSGEGGELSRPFSLAPGVVVFCDNPRCGQPSVVSYALYECVSPQETCPRDFLARGEPFSDERQQRWRISEYYTRMCVAGEMLLGTPLYASLGES